MSVVFIDDTDSGIRYSGSWTASGTLTGQSNEYNATVHRADQSGSTGEYTFTGTRITVCGTLEAPGVYGYPSATYTIDNGSPQTFDLSRYTQSIDISGNSRGVAFYQTDYMPSGRHTLKWTVTNASPSGPRYYLDLFIVEGVNPTQGSQLVIDDRDPSIQYSGSWAQNSNFGEYLQSDSTAPASGGSSLTWRFTGTGISAFGTIYANQNPPAQIDIQVDSTHYAFTAPSFSRTVMGAMLFQVSGLSSGQHQITMTGKASSSWSLDYFVYQPFGGAGPAVNYVVEAGSSGGATSVSGSGSTVGSGTGPNQSGAAVNPIPTGNTNMSMPLSSGTGGGSVFVSYSMSNGVPVPVLTYTSVPGESTGDGSLSAATGNANKSGISAGVIAGAAMAGVAGVVLIIFLFWWIRRRKQIRQMELQDASVKESAEWTSSEIASSNAALNAKKRAENNQINSRNTAPAAAAAAVGRGAGAGGARSNRPREKRAPRISVGPTPSEANLISPVAMSAQTTTADTYAETRTSSEEPSGSGDQPVRESGGEVHRAALDARPRERPRRRRRRVIREVDGGVRLATGESQHSDDESSDSEGSVEILPPSYEQHRASPPS